MLRPAASLVRGLALGMILGLVFAGGAARAMTVDESEPNGDAARANRVSLGDDYRGAISPGSDVDVVRVFVPSVTVVQATTVLGTLPDSVLELLDIDGLTVLAANDNFGGTPASQLTALVLESGTYFVAVRAASATQTGSYTLELRGFPLCGDATGDGTVSVTDGVNVLRAAAGLPNTCTLAACDTDHNGVITVTDGVNVLRAAAGLSNVCPVIIIIPLRCGNGRLDLGEECDDGNLVPGDGCDELCRLESQVCHLDGRREGLEQCDGDDLGGRTCESFGFTSGGLQCTNQCTFDFSGCVGPDEDCAPVPSDCALPGTSCTPQTSNTCCSNACVADGSTACCGVTRLSAIEQKASLCREDSDCCNVVSDVTVVCGEKDACGIGTCCLPSGARWVTGFEGTCCSRVCIPFEFCVEFCNQV